MSFGKKELEKYGWNEGTGLGRKRDGISKPIRPKLKFDKHGFGFKIGDQYNNWWDLMYNHAVRNVSIQAIQGFAPKQARKDLNKKSGARTEKSSSPVKPVKLTQDGLPDLEMKTEEQAENSGNPSFKVLTDDELFLACGGRTAHKGARHGLKQSGKLSRIEKQEKMLLRKLKNVSLSDDEYVLKKKVKKLSKHKEICQHKVVNDDEMVSVHSSGSHKKKHKKTPRRVSFNELATEYHDPPEAEEASVEDRVPVIVEARIRDDNDNEINEANHQIEQDEGIEQDFDESEGCLHSEERFSLDKLSKKERKLLKKRRKLERKSGATARFLEDLGVKQEAEENSESALGKCKKRKNDPLKLDEVVTKKLHCTLEEMKDNSEKLERIKAKKHKRKAEKKQAKQMNLIAESLNQVCRISDVE